MDVLTLHALFQTINNLHYISLPSIYDYQKAASIWFPLHRILI